MTESDPNPETTATAPAAPPAPPVRPPDSILIWVCPRCQEWAGSSNLGNLAAIQNRRSSLRNLAHEKPSEWGKSTGSRAICQSCRQQGRGDVERVPVEYIPVSRIGAVLERQVEEAYQREEKQSGIRIPRRTDP